MESKRTFSHDTESPGCDILREIIIIGTDPNTTLGGVSAAVKAHEIACSSNNIKHRVINSHKGVKYFGKWLYWILSVASVLKIGITEKHRKQEILFYAHAGDWLSIIRKTSLLLLARKMGFYTRLQLHSIRIDRYLNSYIQGALLKTLIEKCVDTVCVLTPWWEQRLRSSGIKSKIQIIPNPLLPEYEAVAKISLTKINHPPSSKFTVLSMARFVEGKGIREVILSMQYLPNNIELLIAGDGPEKKLLGDLVTKHRLSERVRFIGWLDDNEKKQYLSEADIFCLPSDYDSFGLAYVEAMAFGLPVVALRNGPINDVIPHGFGGILIEQKDPELIAEAIMGLLDEDTLTKMGNNAKSWVITQFSSKLVINQLVNGK